MLCYSLWCRWFNNAHLLRLPVAVGEGLLVLPHHGDPGLAHVAAAVGQAAARLAHLPARVLTHAAALAEQQNFALIFIQNFSIQISVDLRDANM